jgi:hypothetical protein
MRRLVERLESSFLAAAAAGIFCYGSGALAQANTDLAATNAWRMWPDSTAAWQNDGIYLPGVSLASLPVNPPTGGWSVLNNSQGTAVTLPASVEQYYWGAFGGGTTGGNYKGVSWWWTTFSAPAVQPGQRLLIQFRAARLRAEVYCNGKLVGYNIINEVPFTADVTSAAAPGAATNQLAVRITSPGGDLAWGDYGPITWGTNTIADSRGIGGLDANIVLQVIDPVTLSDFAVLNRPNPQEVWVIGAVTNASAAAYNGPVNLSIQDSNGVAVWLGTNILTVAAGSQASFTNDAVVGGATPWDITNPVLYSASAVIPGDSLTAVSANFGFRWFTPVGFGSNAMLQFNGRRIVLHSAISWGWWAPDGLFPTDAMAQKEVLAAQTLGLNCLQFHRNLGHPNVLNQQDQLGLLRYEEPGDGEAVFGTNISGADIAPTNFAGVGGAPVTFLQQYEADKILAMVKRDRSHPSLVVYDIQNEFQPCLTNASIFWLFQQIRQMDPSRTVVLHSGIGGNNEVCMLPYSTNFLYDNGTGYSGWNDQHTVGGPGNYQDSLYINATNYSHYQPDTNEIGMWGEMLGVGIPDDHQAAVTWYQTNGVVTNGYDLPLHQQDLTAYNGFMDKWGFRTSYPSASSLFYEIGKKSYFFWQKMMENARISDANDFDVISGWESTIVENHSGLVDAHRNFRTDPSILRRALNPEVLVIRPKRFVLKPGDTANVDVHLINEVGRSGAQTLTVTAYNPDGSVLFTVQNPVTVAGGNVFGQVLATNLIFFPATNGTIRILGSIQPNGGTGDVLTNETDILAIDPTVGSPVMSRVVVCEPSNQISSTLSNVFKLNTMTSSNLGAALDAIVMTPLPNTTWRFSTYTTTATISNTLDSGLFQNQMYGSTGIIGNWFGFAPGNVTVQLDFAETYFTTANSRVFDVAINGTTVLTNFDIYSQAGGKNIAVVETFAVNCTNGEITVSVPRIEQNNFQIAALKITDASNNVTAVVFSGSSFTDHSGLTWQPYVNSLVALMPVTNPQWQTALSQVYSNGARLVLWPNAIGEGLEFANALAASGIVSVQNLSGNDGSENGYLPQAGAPWLGSWYFCRQHWLLANLPVNSVLGWQYQIPHTGVDVGALLLDSTPLCPMDVMIGYGRDHENIIGVGGCVIQYGKGIIVLPSLPGLRDALTTTNAEITQPVAQMLLGNALRPVSPAAPMLPTDLAAVPGNAQVTLTWNPAFGGTTYNLKRSTTSGGPYTTIATNLTGLSYQDVGLANHTTYYYVVSAVNALGEGPNSPEAGAMPQTWAGLDIGSVGAAGSTSQSGDTITVTGSGSDIYGTADAFQFAPQLITGDCDLRALVSSVGDTDPWAKAGVMIRETLDPGAKNITMVMSYGNGAEIQYRSASAGATAYSTLGGKTAPYWVRLTRTGNVLSGYISPDGTTWTQVGGSQTITMNPNVYAGLAVTSHNNGVLCTATFNKVSLTSLPSPWLSADIGSPGVTGSAFCPNGVFTLLGSGADISGTGDAFRFAYVTGGGDCNVRAQVLSVGNTDPSAKAGVMIRETQNTNAANAALVVTPGNGISFQYRASTGGTTTSTAASPLLPPYWVQLVRTGNTFAGYVSADGTNWLQAGATETITMASNTYAGLLTTSHNNSALCTATFTNVTAGYLATSTNQPASAISLGGYVSSSGQMSIQWPYAGNLNGIGLYASPTLGAQAIWTPVTNSLVLSNTVWQVALPDGAHTEFYRLIQN